MPDTAESTAATADGAAAISPNGSTANGGGYVLPLVHRRVSDRAVDAAFWTALALTVLVDAVDLPLGLLIGAGVVVARHQRRAR